MLLAGKVRVSADNDVVQANNGSDACRSKDFTSNALVHTGNPKGAQVVKETIRRSVLAPVIVTVDRAPVLAALFSVRDILDGREFRNELLRGAVKLRSTSGGFRRCRSHKSICSGDQRRHKEGSAAKACHHRRVLSSDQKSAC